MAMAAGDEQAYLHVLRVVMIAPPFRKAIIAVEAARRAIPGHVRPSFQEIEKTCRGGGNDSAAAASA
jgi:chemotaxis protein MotA